MITDRPWVDHYLATMQTGLRAAYEATTAALDELSISYIPSDAGFFLAGRSSAVPVEPDLGGGADALVADPGRGQREHHTGVGMPQPDPGDLPALLRRHEPGDHRRWDPQGGRGVGRHRHRGLIPVPINGCSGFLPSGRRSAKADAMANHTPIVPAGSEDSYQRFQFAPAVRTGNTVYVSGVIGSGADGSVPDDPGEEFAAAFSQLAATLTEAGATMADVVELTSFHTDMSTLGKFMKAKSAVMGRAVPGVDRHRLYRAGHSRRPSRGQGHRGHHRLTTIAGRQRPTRAGHRRSSFRR